MNKLSHLFLILLFLASVFTAQGQGINTNSRKLESRQKRQAAPQTPAKWRTFTGPDRDFTVELPGEPVREPDVYGLGRTVRGYSLVKNFVHFQILLQDTGLEQSHPDGDKLPLDFAESMVKDIESKGGTILRTQLLRINVYELEAWVPFKNHPGQSLHFIERFIARNGQLYHLTCTSLIPDQKLDAAVYRRFFNSFRVIGPPRPL